MSREGSDYEFVTMDASEIEADIAAMYTAITGRTVSSGPDLLFIQWIASILMLCNANVNKAGNANIASRAEGEDLDALARDIYGVSRPSAVAAGVMMQFTISAAQSAAVLIPAGTRVTTANNDIVFATDEDVYVQIGNTTASIHATCQTEGTDGNGLAIGSINVCVDPFTYYASCTNTDESGGGSDEPDDDEFYDLMKAALSAYSTAGAIGAYEYFAKSVSGEIADVIVNSPSAGNVSIYAIMDDGSLAGAEVKAAILAACSAKDKRPLTDNVSVSDPTQVAYNISFTYYLANGTTDSAATMAAAVQDAVNDYIAWQSAKMGRDINPSKLIQLVMATGVKRVVITSPTYTVLSSGDAEPGDDAEDFVPDIAKVGTITITNGGYEDE